MTICGLDCCKACSRLPECGGCEKCSGHPFGGTCIAAETIRTGGKEAFEQLKRELVLEINALNIPELQINDLNLLNGQYVNLAYPLPGGLAVQFLTGSDIYLANQVERSGSERCYGVVAGRTFLLVSEYGSGGADAEIVLYKRR